MSDKSEGINTKYKFPQVKKKQKKKKPKKPKKTGKKNRNVCKSHIKPPTKKKKILNQSVAFSCDLFLFLFTSSWRNRREISITLLLGLFSFLPFSPLLFLFSFLSPHSFLFLSHPLPLSTGN